jgi:hypothetical protein
MVFLKQFPTVGSTRRAVYQAVVEAPNVLGGNGIKGAGPIPGSYRVEVPRYDSCRIAEQLGLKLDGANGRMGTAQSLFQFWMAFDFEVRAGTVIHNLTHPTRG